MPPLLDGHESEARRPRPRYERSGASATDHFPSVIEHGELSELPAPVRVVVTALALPFEAAVSSVRILQNTEALLGELVFHLRALRPAVVAVSQAYADGHFDPVFRAFEQIQQGTNAIAFVWSPFSAVRDVLTPGQAKERSPASPPVRIAPAPEPAPPAPPTTAAWLGGIGERVLDQATELPGGSLLARPLRFIAQPWSTGRDPV